MSKVSDIITNLQQRKKSIACNGKEGLLMLLAALGFEATQGQANHYIFTHSKLSELTEFTTFSIDCGHLPKKPMKLPYIVNTIRILKQYEPELSLILNEKIGKNNDLST